MPEKWGVQSGAKNHPENLTIQGKLIKKNDFFNFCS
jgi:hypothetical protein